jgi:hypothetical protein
MSKKDKKYILDKSLLKEYLSLLDTDIAAAFKEIEAKELSNRNFNFYTAVSVMSSSRIEGEKMEIDSYVKHKMQDIEYLPDLTEKPNDLFAAYEFARKAALTKENFLQAHAITTAHLLPAPWRGVIRTGNMVIMDHRTNRVQYEAASGNIVKTEFDSFWNELDKLLTTELTLEEIFYFEKAWYIASEYYYYNHITDYYKNLARVGLFYDELTYEKSLPFLVMLPKALVTET